MRRAALGGDLDVADVFVDLCRTVLAGGSGAGAEAGAGTVPGAGTCPGAGAFEPGSERFHVVLQKCPSCDDVVHVGHGPAAHVVAPSTAAQAECDAVVVDVASGGRTRRTIPPSVRRRVAHRDGYGCAVPGCGARLWLDVHHLIPRAHGGTHDETNLLQLCPGHHRRVHEGTLQLVRGADGAIVARRGTAAPTEYGQPVSRSASNATHVGHVAGAAAVSAEVGAEVSAPLAAAIEGCAAEYGWLVPELVIQRLGSPCPPDELAEAIATVASFRGWSADADGWYACA